MEISEEEAWVILGAQGDEDGETSEKELKLEKRIRKEFPDIDENLKKSERMEIRTVLTIEVDDEDCDPIEKVEELLHTIATNGECICDYADICTRNNEEEKWKNILGVV